MTHEEKKRTENVESDRQIDQNPPVDTANGVVPQDIIDDYVETFGGAYYGSIFGGYDPSKPTVSVVATDPIGKEPNTPDETPDNTIKFTFSRTGNTSNSLKVNFTTRGTATELVDFDASGVVQNDSITIPRGDSDFVLKIFPKYDTRIEGKESIIITLKGGEYVIDSEKKQATAWIYDNTLPEVAVRTVIAHAQEGGPDEPTETPTGTPIYGNKLVWEFGRTGSIEDELEIYYAISGTAESGADYSSVSTGSILFEAGKRTTKRSIQVLDDIIVEGDETVIIKVLEDSAVPARYVPATQNTAEGTIHDNDGPAVVTIRKKQDGSEAKPDEPIKNIIFTLKREGGKLYEPLHWVYYATMNTGGTATPGEDYQPHEFNPHQNLMHPMSISFPAYHDEVDLEITVKDDFIVEGLETVIVKLKNTNAFGFPVTNYVLGNPSQATANIEDYEGIQVHYIVETTLTGLLLDRGEYAFWSEVSIDNGNIDPAFFQSIHKYKPREEGVDWKDWLLTLLEELAKSTGTGDKVKLIIPSLSVQDAHYKIQEIRSRDTSVRFVWGYKDENGINQDAIKLAINDIVAEGFGEVTISDLIGQSDTSASFRKRLVTVVATVLTNITEIAKQNVIQYFNNHYEGYTIEWVDSINLSSN